jgi:hypothetical protein
MTYPCITQVGANLAELVRLGHKKERGVLRELIVFPVIFILVVVIHVFIQVLLVIDVIIVVVVVVVATKGQDLFFIRRVVKTSFTFLFIEFVEQYLKTSAKLAYLNPNGSPATQAPSKPCRFYCKNLRPRHL